MLTWLANIPRRMGYDVGRHGFLYTDTWDMNTTDVYEKEIAQSIVENLLKVQPLNFVPAYVDPIEENKFLNSIEERFEICSEMQLIGVNMGVSELTPIKAWNPQKFAELIIRIDNTYDGQIVLLGVASDRRIYEQVKHLLPDSVINRIGLTSVFGLSLWLRRCQLLITNNTGTMQLAAFLNTPTVVINGPSSIPRWAPRGDSHHIVSKHLPCSAQDCDGAQCETNISCMTDISVEEVFEAVAGKMPQKETSAEYRV